MLRFLHIPQYLSILGKQKRHSGSKYNGKISPKCSMYIARLAACSVQCLPCIIISKKLSTKLRYTLCWPLPTFYLPLHSVRFWETENKKDVRIATARPSELDQASDWPSNFAFCNTELDPEHCRWLYWSQVQGRHCTSPALFWNTVLFQIVSIYVHRQHNTFLTLNTYNGFTTNWMRSPRMHRSTPHRTMWQLGVSRTAVLHLAQHMVLAFWLRQGTSKGQTLRYRLFIKTSEFIWFETKFNRPTFVIWHQYLSG